jgi:putative nucleotidyltransferase with HDIG domain
VDLASRRSVCWFSLLAFIAGVSIVLAVERLIRAAFVAADWAWLATLTLLAFCSLFRQVRLATENSQAVYTLDDVPLFALVFLQGWPSAVVAAGASRLLFSGYRGWRRVKATRVSWVDRYVDVPATIVVVAAAGLVYARVNAGAALFSGPRNLLGIALVAVVSHLLVFSLKALHQAVRSSLPAGRILQLAAGDPAIIRLQVLMLVPLAALLALFVERAPLALALLGVPVSLIHSALEAQFKLRSESEKTIQALAHSLEERDQYTQGHSTRVAAYAVEIARAMGLPKAILDQVRRAGLIHDIGKIDIPDAILRKPGHLSTHEREIMRTHTDRAVELGNKLVALRQELPFREAAYHHENYDGSGHYRLAEDQIPLVSRILAVADTFDAMTSDRPYRKGMPCEDALTRLRQASSTQLDPKAVDAFLVAFENGAIPKAMAAARLPGEV